MVVAVIAAVVACVIGWHASMAIGTHQGIPVRRAQLRGYRKDRMHYGVRTIALATVLGLIIVVVVLH
jgi:hypothetical protein